MGIFQNLLATYDKCTDAVGITPIDSDGLPDARRTLLPMFHTTFKSHICVTVDETGNFISAERDSKETTIIIPCTEKSAGRSSGDAAHPLCDQLDYVGGISANKSKDYLDTLAAWKDNHSALNAIFAYVSKNGMIQDLSKIEIFKDAEYILTNEENKQLDLEKTRKLGVRFRVIQSDAATNVWEDKDIRQLWIHHISNRSVESDRALFDYMSGERIFSVASQHPKNINSMTGNAKLLSCNDSDGFTYRGRFGKQDDAVLIDYTQSQKMHQMLRWLIANHGYSADSQVIVAWAVSGDTEVAAKPHENSFELFSNMASKQTDTDILEYISEDVVYAHYTKMLNKLLLGYGSTGGIKKHANTICVAVFDAATTGRMGLVFYQEFPEGTYLERIVSWHEDTSYFLTAWKKEKNDDGKEFNKPIHYLGAPSYDDILFAVYGKPRSGNDSGYSTLKRKMRKQLLECMFGNFSFPKSFVEMAAIRASKPMSFTDSNDRFSENDWKRAISITCALARKYYKQQGDELALELDEKRTDRDYLFGRLLSVADKLEKKAFYKSDKQDQRTTNATRLMNAFQVKPYSTWGQLFSQMIPYKAQLNGAGYYQSLIDKILVAFPDGEYENNAPLSPLYLLGFAAQNRALENRNKKQNDTEENEDVFAE